MRRLGMTPLLLLAVGFTACSGSQPRTDPSALTLEEFEKNSENTQAPPPNPVANPDEDAVDECEVECYDNSDCCEGYYCGKDPEKSQRKDYCLPGG